MFVTAALPLHAMQLGIDRLQATQFEALKGKRVSQLGVGEELMRDSALKRAD